VKVSNEDSADREGEALATYRALFVDLLVRRFVTRCKRDLPSDYPRRSLVTGRSRSWPIDRRYLDVSLRVHF